MHDCSTKCLPPKSSLFLNLEFFAFLLKALLFWDFLLSLEGVLSFNFISISIPVLHHELVDRYGIFISKLAMDIFLFTYILSFLYHWQYFYLTFLYYDRVTRSGCLIRNKNCRRYPSWPPGFTPMFLVGFVFSFCFLSTSKQNNKSPF